jgi:hypothetical protein
MKAIIAGIALSFALSPFALAQEKKPSAAQQKQQARMKECNEKAAGKTGEERQAFMSSCLKSGASGRSAAQQKQQNRMKSCNKEANEKKLKGSERRSFMSSCLKG